MENLHRVFLLDGLLRSHKYPIATQTLVSKLECSLSTFKRLIRMLREQYNYPIVYSSIYKGYFYDHKKATQISGLWLNSKELHAILIIQNMLEQLQPGLLDDYFQPLLNHIQKLLASATKSVNNRLKRFRMIPIAHQYIKPEIFLPLCQATLENQMVQLDYQDIQGSHTQRCLSPQRLVYYRNNWYLDAWCHLRQALRTFWLAGVKSVALLNQSGEIVEDTALAQHLESSYGIFAGLPVATAHLRFTGFAAMRIRELEWHPQQKQQINADGSLEVWLPYSDTRELVMDILRYGNEAKVLAPESLQIALIEQLKTALNQYNEESEALAQ